MQPSIIARLLLGAFVYLKTRYFLVYSMILAFMACSGGGEHDVDIVRPGDSGKQDLMEDSEIPVVIPDDGRPDTPPDPDVEADTDDCDDCLDAFDAHDETGTIEEGTPGAPCSENDECHSGFCIDSPGGRVCARLCDSSTACPDGTRCLQVQGEPDVMYACVYLFTRLCLPCNSDISCVTPLAVGAPACMGDDDGWFCGSPCASDEDCPSTHHCRLGKSIDNVNTRQCVPKSGTCPCTQRAVDEGIRTACAISNEFGRCPGERYCLDTGLSECSAMIPVAEICDGIDNDCNGITDDVEPVACMITNRWGSCPGTARCLNGKDDCYGIPPEREVCNGIDDNCDGRTDEQGAIDCINYHKDQDQDGYGLRDDAKCLCGPEYPYTATPRTDRDYDCDDNNANVHPNAVEICNGIDDNCDQRIDEENAQGCEIFYRDLDMDGYGLSTDFRCLCAGKGSYTATLDGDCDDTNNKVYPGAIERCNGIDDNCDGRTDPEGSADCQPYYYDGDRDGYGTASRPSKCLCGPEYSSRYTSLNSNDCDDTNAEINPARPEICGDGIDNNCNGQTDEDNAQGCILRYEDNDGDGYGTGSGLCICGLRPPYTADVGGDCNDLNRNINPGKPELCGDGIDNNCNGDTDEEGAVGCVDRYYDFDGDGYGVGAPRCLCADEGYYTALEGGDCDDHESSLNPGQPELCFDGIDNNCNGKTDEEGAQGCEIYYADRDNDGYGNPSDSKCLCSPTDVYTSRNNRDCDDTNKDVNPDMPELCGDNIDNNCNGKTDEEGAQGCVDFYYDGDGDNYGALGSTPRCLCGPDVAGKFTATLEGDCNDSNPAINPGAREICEPEGVPPVDDNCNGLLNEENAVGCVSYYYDGDGDGRGSNPDQPKCFCRGGNPAIKYTSLYSDDCNDNDPEMAPGLEEKCDGKDNDCDGFTDEEGAIGCDIYYKDHDQDGYGNDIDFKCLCSPDLLNRYTATEAGDCDDENSAIHPGASVCGIDADCDGNFLDPGEECDDGNTIAWDGCTNCQITEFRVNYNASMDQWMPAVAPVANGNYAVIFQSWQALKDEEIALRFVDATGKPQGNNDIWVNSFKDNPQTAPHIAVLPNGNLVAVWESTGQDSQGKAVILQRLTPTGTKIGGEILVNSFTQYDQRRPSVAALPDNGFVVVWQSYLQDGDNNGIVARRFNADGSFNGSEFVVNQTTAGVQDSPRILGLDDGGFIIVWRSAVSRGPGVSDYDIFMRLYNNEGAAIGGEQLVNTTTTKNQSNPSIAQITNNQYVVVWDSEDQDGSGLGIYGQRFTLYGTEHGPEFRINSTTISDQAQPVVAGFPSTGRWVVLWRSNAQDGSGQGTYAQRFYGPAAYAGEFRVHEFTTSDQWYPAAACHADQFLVTWSSYAQDGSGYGVYGRLFSW